MTTPIYDFLNKYTSRPSIRLHMPGHKGRGLYDLSFDHDITEIHGADSLFEDDGIILQSEINASLLFGTKKTCYSTSGSTLCIQAMLALAKGDGRNIIALRNVHRSFIAACVLLDIQPIWLYPKYKAGFLSGEVELSQLEKVLSLVEKPCVYITSPDYLGKTADIKAIADITHRHSGILVVDNAHGAHTVGTEAHPIKQGADMCCDSAHKMLPCLTGGAYLHIGCDRFTDKAKQAMMLFASTSPSYLILNSLDMCNDYIENSIETDRNRIAQELALLREKIKGKYLIYDSEPFHLTLLCDGINLSQQLRTEGIECEYCDSYCIVLLFSPFSRPEDVSRTAQVLMQLDPHPCCTTKQFTFPQMQQAVSIRQAALADHEIIPVENSIGRICGMVNVPCPPAVPIAVSGEVITDECVELYRQYGIPNVAVMSTPH